MDYKRMGWLHWTWTVQMKYFVSLYCDRFFWSRDCMNCVATIINFSRILQSEFNSIFQWTVSSGGWDFLMLNQSIEMAEILLETDRIDPFIIVHRGSTTGTRNCWFELKPFRMNESHEMWYVTIWKAICHFIFSFFLRAWPEYQTKSNLQCHKLA